MIGANSILRRPESVWCIDRVKGPLDVPCVESAKGGHTQKFDKLGIRFIACVSGTSSEFHGRIKVGEHVYFAGWVLRGG